MVSDPTKDDHSVENTDLPRTTRSRSWDTIRQNSDFRLVWIGNFFAAGAQWLQVLTVGWLVLALTDNNALMTGSAVGIRTLPVLIIGPWAGVLVDRVDRRKLIMVTQTGMAVAAVIFAFLVIASDLDSGPVSGPLRVWHAFLYMVVAGVAHALIQPVRQAMVANTVPRESLTSAFALNAMTFPISRIVAPALGGLTIALLGFKVNFFLEAAAYVAMVLLLLPVKLRYREQTQGRHSSMLAELREGLSYVWTRRVILQNIVVVMIPNLVSQPLTFVLPIFTVEVLHRGAGSGGVLASAIGAGGVIAAFGIAIVGFVFRKGTATFVGLIGGCLFVLLFARSEWFLVSIVFLAGLGFCQYTCRTANATLLQIVIEDGYRGRVMSIYQLDNGLMPLSTLLISLFIHLWNPADAFTVVAGVSLVFAVYQALAFRQVRQLE